MPLPEPLRVSDGTLVSLEPLEQLRLPPDLDGGRGTNRALGARSQIAAPRLVRINLDKAKISAPMQPATIR